MPYLAITIFYYNQLLKINQDLISDLEKGIDRIAEQSRFTRLHNRDGNFLFSLGDKDKLDPGSGVEFAHLIYDEIQKYHEDMFGFNIFLTVSDEKNLKKMRLLVSKEKKIWLDEEANNFFSKVIQSRKIGDYWELLSKETVQHEIRTQGNVAWNQGSLVKKVVKVIDEQAANPDNGRGILITGSVTFERKFLIDAVQKHIFGRSQIPSAPRLFTLFRRRSVVHPLLNSVDARFISEAHCFLRDFEIKIWNNLESLLKSLKMPADYSSPNPFKNISLREVPASSAEDASIICPDHLYEDFYLAYQLYLSAYFRMMEENFLPALLIVENIETYHPDTIKVIKRLVQDFYHNPVFIPVITSSKKKLPEELNFLKIHTIDIHQVSLKKVERIVSSRFPGLKLSREECRCIRKVSRGKLLPLNHTLMFLKAESWTAGNLCEEVFPPHPLSITWYVVATLSKSLQHILYIIYLQAGIMDSKGLISFLLSLAVKEETIHESLKELIGYGLIYLDDYCIPIFPGLRKRLRKKILQTDTDLEERFVEYLIQKWKEDRFPNLVLLFFLIIKTPHSQAALEVLARLLKRKLDELDFTGVEVFLKREKSFAVFLDSDERKKLSLLLISAKIRLTLLKGELNQAETLYSEAAHLLGDYDVNPEKGELLLQLARYSKMKGETALAMDWAKQSLIQFQRINEPKGEQEATTELGSILLAEGKIEEAIEYFSFSLSKTERPVLLDDIRVLALRSSALFITGNLSLSRSDAERGLALAASAKNREWELFMIFMLGRINFEMGCYEDAVEDFQKGLNFLRLYPLEAAKKIFYAWLGRSYAYLRKTETAQRILMSQEDNYELCFFLGESYYFAGNFSKALEVMSRALPKGHREVYFQGEKVIWADGFTVIEGRCFDLLKGYALLQRLIRTFQAYLWGLEGQVEKGVDQLHSITRGEKIPDTDPYLRIYNFFYASTLPEVRKREMDDCLTVLSKAHKLLQQRASCIEDSQVRRKFMSQNHWSVRLLEAAKNKNLI